MKQIWIHIWIYQSFRNVALANNIILSCLLFFLLTVDLVFLIPAVITQITIISAELATPTGIPIKDAKVEIETHPVTAEVKTSKCPVEFKIL